MKQSPKPKASPKASGPSWPADKVERRPVADLVPYARNARTHSPAQVAQIAASIQEWGWTIPCLIDEKGGIIAGHGRVLAAQKLGLAEIPVMVATGWTEAQKRAYVIADNKLALNAEWDEELLRVELSDLSAAGDFELGLIGFNDAELAKLMNGDGVNDPNAEWDGMPEFSQSDKSAFRSIVVHFKDQAAVDAFTALIEQTITPSTKFVWYPLVEVETYSDKRYAAVDAES